MKKKTNMKRIAIFMTALVLLATGCHREQTFTIEGNLSNSGFDILTDSLLLQSDAFPVLISIPIQDGKYSYTGKVEKPVAASLRAVGGKMTTQMVVLEKGGVITFEYGQVQGTKLNDAATALSRSLRTISKEHAGDRAAISDAAFQAVSDYLADHGKDPSAVLAVMMARRYVTPDKLSDLIAKTSPEIQNDSHVHRFKKQLKAMKRRAPAQSE